jgi:hypothetical protein
MIDKKKIEDFSFTGLIINKTPKQIFKLVETQLLIDTQYVQQLTYNNQPDDKFILAAIYYFISKYSFFITYYEQNEEYEYAGQLNKHILALLIDLEISEEILQGIIARSIEGFRNKIN